MEFLRTITCLFGLLVVAAGQSELIEEEYNPEPQDLKPVILAIDPTAIIPKEIPAGDMRRTETESETEVPLPPKIPDVPDMNYDPKEHMDMDYPSDYPEPIRYMTPQVKDPDADGEELGSGEANYLFPNEPMPTGDQQKQSSYEEAPLDSPPMRQDEMGGPELYATTNERSEQTEENDLLTSLEISVCAEVTCRTPFKDRVKSWMCEYTKYSAELISWIIGFEEWWHGCEESYTESAGISSVQCPDVSQVKCENSNKKLCADDRMGCTRCVCKDGQYADSVMLLRLWRKEMEAFKKRFEAYKTKVSSCTRIMSMSNEECDAEDSSEEPGQGEDANVPDEKDVDNGPGEGSGVEEEDINYDNNTSGDGSGEEEDIDVGSGGESGSGREPGYGEGNTIPNEKDINVGSGEESGSGKESGLGEGQSGSGVQSGDVIENPESPTIESMTSINPTVGTNTNTNQQSSSTPNSSNLPSGV